MRSSFFSRLFRAPQPRTIRTAPPRPRLGFEGLEARDTPAVTAVFDAGVLSVFGDAGDNNIAVNARPDGTLVVTSDAAQTVVPIQVKSGTPTLAQTTLVRVDGGAGNDVLTMGGTLNLRNAAGVLVASPNSVLTGGDGNDRIQVFNGGFLNGVIGGPTVGNSVMDGGAGNDQLISGFGNDTMRGGAGDDTYVWNPGTLTDTWDGGAGNDTAVINGNSGNDANDDDAFLLRKKPDGSGRVLFDRTNLVPFTVDIGTTEAIVLNPDLTGDATATGNDTVTIGDLTGLPDLRAVTVTTGGGNDAVNAATGGGVFLAIDGGAGNDRLVGSRFADRISGGDGNDVLIGVAGADELFGGNGNDLLVASRNARTVEGGPGADKIVFFGIDLGTGQSVTAADFNPAEGDTLGDPNGI